MLGFEESLDRYVGGVAGHDHGGVELGEIIEGSVQVLPPVELVAGQGGSGNRNEGRMQIISWGWRGNGSPAGSEEDGEQILVLGEVGGIGQVAGMRQDKRRYGG